MLGLAVEFISFFEKRLLGLARFTRFMAPRPLRFYVALALQPKPLSSHAFPLLENKALLPHKFQPVFL